jgi:Na+-driven multidrug efflux pump
MLFFAQYWGAGDDDGITRSYGMMLSFMMLVAAIFTVLTVRFPGFVMSVYTDKEEIRQIGIGYLRIVGLLIPCRSWRWP